jgi:hypothetical protein
MLPISFLIQAHLVTNAEATQLEGWMTKFPHMVRTREGMMDPTTFALAIKLIRERGYQEHLGLKVENSFEVVKNE